MFYDCWRGKDFIVASFYFIVLIFVGSIIMLNLFLAMLLGNFERASLIQQVQNEEERLAIILPTVIEKQKEMAE